MLVVLYFNRNFNNFEKTRENTPWAHFATMAADGYTGLVTPLTWVCRNGGCHVLVLQKCADIRGMLLVDHYLRGAEFLIAPHGVPHYRQDTPAVGFGAWDGGRSGTGGCVSGRQHARAVVR